MEENKNAKRREHIKTILIIFLAFLLALTFFSNTILNYSLPTVQAQYASYGQISEKVRGSGVVTANQKYNVNAEGNRTVTKVKVKLGDTVKEGDELFILGGSESDDSIKMAESELRAAELDYQKALLTLAPDYAKENQEIKEAREDLQTAINTLNNARSQSGSAISSAAYQQAMKQVTEIGEQIATLKGYLTMLESGETDGIPAEYMLSQADAQAAYAEASAAYETAKADLEFKQSLVTVSSAEQQATVTGLDRAAETADTAAERAKADYEASEGDVELKRLMEDAQSAAKYAHEDADAAKAVLDDILAKEADVKTAQEVFDAAEDALASAQDALSGGKDAVAVAINSAISNAQRDLDAANATVSAYDAQGETQDISTLEADVTAKERNLQSLILTLAETKKTDDLTAKTAAIDLQSQQNAIEEKRDALEKLKKNSGTTTVKAKNAGVIAAVNVAAGDDVTDGMTLAEISLTDSGYIVEFSVTGEQARKVKVGVNAEVTNNYYSDIKATLISAKADTSNPSSQDKNLVFQITGRDVTPGQLLALSIPCSSQNYDCVVPSSAIQEDNDGKFVLVMQSKSTPLGNRYYASRVNVSILASDDINSAVQGEINASDFVITNSEKPLKPGNQVRMEDQK